jgi:DNA invertase Pin-like site-specific DNA recombinase
MRENHQSCQNPDAKVLTTNMYLAYVRVSTASQENSIDSQKRAIIAFLAQKGIQATQVRFYEDLGISGSKQSRPALDLMLSDLEAYKGATVVCYSLSRLGRSVMNLLSLIERFQSQNVSLISVTEHLDINTPFGRLILNLLASLAQMERELIVSRVKMGLEGARARGVRLGRPAKRNSDLIQELNARGCTRKEIAQLAGVSAATVSRELNGFFQKAV